MREIKFRAFIPIKKEMFYDWGVDSAIGEAFYRKICPETEIEKTGRGYDLPEISDWQKEIIFLQYINKKDINGKEIYSGDILRDIEGRFKDIIVCYDEESDNWIDQWECKYVWQSLKEGKFEVIGNIYENNKLVKENS